MAELTGKAISELPAATTIGNSDLLALSQNGVSKKVTPPVLLSGVESEIRGLNSSLATYVRPNLLENWYFVGGGSQLGGETFPINQRGQTSYSGGTPAVDRWKSDVVMTIQASGIKLSAANQLYQNRDDNFYKKLIGKTITISAIIDGVLHSGSITCPAVPSTTTVYNTSDSQIKMAVYNDGKVQIARILANVDEAISAAKVEIGTTQTLAHQENGVWVLNEIPDYGEQLAKCQRYLFTPVERNAVYQVYGIGPAVSDSNAVITITVSKPMAKIVTLATNIDTSKLKLNNTIPITNISISNISGVTAKVIVTCATGALTLGNCYFLTNAGNTNPTFLISAE